MNKKSVLFMPFLQIPSGHHQVADSLMEELKTLSNLDCEKIDILAYGYGKIEKFISYCYLKWIAYLPQLYNFVYQYSVCRSSECIKRYRLYELLFLYFMKRLLAEKRPDLIVCTHALPAYMADILKAKKQLKVPVINVYTDFFIHNFWGIKHIDYHFVATPHMKAVLKKRGIPEERIFITGIPVHFQLRKLPSLPQKNNPPAKVLIAGGNLGVGGLEQLIEEIKDKEHKNIQFYILCGKNQSLYDKLKKMDRRHLLPFSYIQCRKEMNRLYDQMDAVVTKPGGVTVSESLFKRKPIFIYDALPGQEKINQQQLLNLGVAFSLPKGKVCEEILTTLADKERMENYFRSVEQFHSHKACSEPQELIAGILKGAV